MITFKIFLTEGYRNLFLKDREKRLKYADEAFDLLVKAYKKVGGIHGRGFGSPQEMIDFLPFWKLRFSPNGKLACGAFYKDTSGRKRVAVFTDGSELGKKYLGEIMVKDLEMKRSYGEISSRSLNFLISLLGYEELKKYIITPEELSKKTGEQVTKPSEDDPELLAHPQLKDFFYSRKIGSDYHTKIAFGTFGNTISTLDV